MDRLIGPRLKIKRADKHIQDLDAARKEFIDTRPYVSYSETDPETGALVYKVSVEPHADEGLRDLSVIAGDAIHNLRSALDLLAWQLVEANGQKPGDTTAFPVWRNEGQFIGGNAGFMKGAHRDAISEMRSLKPYKGGNDSLWRLHRLDATDKHRLLLAVGAIPAGTVYHFSIGHQAAKWRVLLKPKEPNVLMENGAEVLRVPAALREYFERQPKPEFTMFVALREAETPLSFSLLPTLMGLSVYTSGLIDRFAGYLA
jgi:hypothetical protein